MAKLALVPLVLALAACAAPARRSEPAPVGDGPPALRDPAALAAYLTRDARSDTERARAIFRWLVENIAYDDEAQGAGAPIRAESVLVARKAICYGYAGAFQLLGRLAGLQVQVVHGWAKGYDWRPGTHFDKPNHAWNAVLLDGRWQLVDATWGAGFVREGRFVKQLDDFYFLPPPEALAFTHLPEDSAWALVARAPSLAEFEAQPVVRAAFFRAGFTAAEARTALAARTAPALVDVFLEPDEPIRFRAAPAEGVLHAGATYRFEVFAPAGTTAVVVNGGRWLFLAPEREVLAVSVSPRIGSLYLAARTRAGDRYRTLLRYRAR